MKNQNKRNNAVKTAHVRKVNVRNVMNIKLNTFEQLQIIKIMKEGYKISEKSGCKMPIKKSS